MRYLAMQVLTWGTIAGAVGSALLLAALDSPLERQLVALPRAELFMLRAEPAGAAGSSREASARPAASARPSSEPASGTGR